MDHHLLSELRSTQLAIEKQIGEVKKTARKMSVDAGFNISAYEVKDMNGSFILAPLLVAKAHILNGIAIVKGGK